MELPKMDRAVASAVISTIVFICMWAGAKFKDVPDDVSTLKTQRIEDTKRVDRMETKMDKILDDQKTILAILQERSREAKP